MKKDKLLKKLEEIFRDVFDNEDLVISNATTADDIEEWDSLMHIHLMITIEKEFNVTFNTSEVIALQNVGEFVDSLNGKIH